MHKRDFEYIYGEKKIRYRVWFSGEDHTIDTVVFLGSVQIDKLPEWVAQQCPPKTAIIQGAPHWHAKEDGSDIPRYMFRFTESAFSELLRVCSVKTLHIVADSQAVPGVVSLFLREPYKAYMHDMALLQPLGFTKMVFDGSDEHKSRLFKKRVIHNGYHQIGALISDGRLRYNHRMLRKIVSPQPSRAVAQYNSGLSYDALPDLRALLVTNPSVVIVCGDRDKIFPAHEIAAALANEDLSVRIIKVKGVPHSPLATRQGAKLLTEAFNFFKHTNT